MNVRTLPFDCDLARRDTVFINKFLGNGSCTFFRKLHIVRTCTCFLISIADNLDRHIVIFHKLCSIEDANLLVLVDLSAIDTEVYHIVYIVVNNVSYNFFTFRTRNRTFTQFVVFSTQSVDLTIQIVQQCIIHRLQHFEISFTQFESQTSAQLSDTVSQVVHRNTVKLFVQQ